MISTFSMMEGLIAVLFVQSATWRLQIQSLKSCFSFLISSAWLLKEAGEKAGERKEPPPQCCITSAVLRAQHYERSLHERTSLVASKPDDDDGGGDDDVCLRSLLPIACALLIRAPPIMIFWTTGGRVGIPLWFWGGQRTQES